MSRQEPMLSPGGIEKAPTGIEGFDEITNGGLPRRRTTLLMGAPGCGKTVFALQTLVNGARQRAEPGIFVAFEEKSSEIIENAATFGWDLPSLEKENLFFLDARMAPDVILTGSFDLIGLLASLKAKIDEMGAKRIVFDSIDVLLALLDDPIAERRELYRIHDWLMDSQMTGMITARTAGLLPIIAPRYDFLEFMADCVVLLQHQVRDHVSLRDVRVLKYRGSGFAEGEFPLLITPIGMELFGPSRAEPAITAFTDRMSTGVANLDTMLKGGYYRGSSVLLTGAPGTAKSTLSGAFADAACRRGEPTLYVSLDESPNELMRNLSSVGIQMTPYLQSGLLRIYWARQQTQSDEARLISLRKLIEEFKPRCLVIDSLSILTQIGDVPASLGVLPRLITLTKQAGITAVFTSPRAEALRDLEAPLFQIMTFVDTWIHLSYIVQAGEQNRLLQIIKSRGTAHSNQVRELVLNDQGITLVDVYAAGSRIMAGTLRHQQEVADRLDGARRQGEIETRRLELESAEAEFRARTNAGERELATRRAALRALENEQTSHDAGQMDRPPDLPNLPGDRGTLTADYSLSEPASSSSAPEQEQRSVE